MSKRLSMVWRWRLAGDHVHVRVFSAMVPDNGDDLDYTRGNAGALTFAAEEWASVTASFPSSWHLIAEDA